MFLSTYDHMGDPLREYKNSNDPLKIVKLCDILAISRGLLLVLYTLEGIPHVLSAPKHAQSTALEQ